MNIKITEITTLDRLPFNKEAIIFKLLPESLPFRHKLLAMGITPGCRVSVIRKAPLGDPIEIKIRDFLLCLRCKEAATIAVKEQSC